MESKVRIEPIEGLQQSESTLKGDNHYMLKMGKPVSKMNNDLRSKNLLTGTNKIIKGFNTALQTNPGSTLELLDSTSVVHAD